MFHPILTRLIIAPPLLLLSTAAVVVASFVGIGTAQLLHLVAAAACLLAAYFIESNLAKLNRYVADPIISASSGEAYPRQLNGLILAAAVGLSLSVCGLIYSVAGRMTGIAPWAFLITLIGLGFAASASLVRSATAWLVVALPPVVLMAALLASQVSGRELLALVAICAVVLGLQAHLRSRGFAAIRRHEELLQSNHASLELAQAQRAEAEQLRSQAEEANRAKSNFLAAASHDLRQPLAALSLYSGVLNHIAKTANVKEVAAQIGLAVKGLEGLFNSLLDYSKLDAGVVQVNSRPISLQALLLRIASEYSQQAEQKSLVFSTEGGDDWVDTDPILFERMVRNLLENAIRYTETGFVKLQWRRSGAVTVIEVVDSGPGIDPELHERIFDEYYQVGNPGRLSIQGLGLGLAIVKKLAGLLQGRVYVESQPGHGSRFVIELPSFDKPVLSRPEAAELSVNIMLSGRRVLLVDDDQRILAAASAALRLRGCAVATAQDRAQALYELDHFEPEVVVMDYRLGDGKTGLRLLNELSQRRSAIRGLIMTGDTGPDPLRETLGSNYKIIHKPVQMAELLTNVAQLLGQGFDATGDTRNFEVPAQELSGALPGTAGSGLRVESKRAAYQLNLPLPKL